MAAQAVQHSRVVAGFEEMVSELQETIAAQREVIQALRDEIARLKGLKPKPQIRPSALNRKRKNANKGKRPGSTKRSKVGTVEIHETVLVPAKELAPPGSRFTGYTGFSVVDLGFEAHNVRYRLEV